MHTLYISGGPSSASVSAAETRARGAEALRENLGGLTSLVALQGRRSCFLRVVTAELARAVSVRSVDVYECASTPHAQYMASRAGYIQVHGGFGELVVQVLWLCC
jgi:hypothetical protein